MTGPRIGFACLWDADPAPTWSHIPWQLRRAMRQHADVVDAGVELSRAARSSLRVLHARWRGGRPVTTWQRSRLTDAICQRQIASSAARQRCDAVLQIQDLAVVDQPFFLFQDMSFDALMHVHATTDIPRYTTASAATLRRRQERQHRIYERAAGVLAMSQWLARSLVELSGLPAEKVHVVHPGTSAVPAAGTALPVREGPRHRLLFVGRDFHRKGGDLAVAALAVLRREVAPSITLTVAGPREWPQPGAVPDGVNFLGPRPLSEVPHLYDTHDLFVMPSRLEAFGIVFAEAAARGLPCVGRNAFAMPEVIEPGVTGALVDGDDPAELARVIAAALADDSLYAKCLEHAAATAERFSWDRAARETVDAIAVTLGRGHRP